MQPAWLPTQAQAGTAPAQVSSASPQVPHLSSLCSWRGLLVSPWPSLMSTDLSGDPWTALTLVTRPDLFTFLGDCGAVSHQWQGLFNAYLIHLPFGIIHNGFKFYNFIYLNYIIFLWKKAAAFTFNPNFFFFFPSRLFYQTDVMKKHVFITIFSL